MEIYERIKQRRKELGLSAETVAERLGVSPATIYRYEKNDIKKFPTEILEPLAKVLHTTPAYLMGWQEDNQVLFNGVLPVPKMVKKPRLGTIACGEPILAQENIETYDDVPERIKCDFTLICKGDSMVNARINDGDVVYIKQQSAVDNGEIAAVLIGDEATLKRVYLYEDKIVLQPENTKYAPLVYSKEEMNNVRIIGKAVGFTSLL